MTTPRKPTPPTNQAEYTAWRAAQKAAEQTAKAEPTTDYASKSSAEQAKANAKQATANARRNAKRAARDAANEARWTAENERQRQADREYQAQADARQAKYDAQYNSDEERQARADQDARWAEYERQAQAERDAANAANDAWRARRAPAPRSKAHKAADLAVSAFWIGSFEEAYTAATRAGALYRKAGQALSDLLRDCPGISHSELWERATAGFTGN